MKSNKIAVLRREGGLAIIDVNSNSVRLIGGFFVFKDFAWGTNRIAALTHNVAMLYDHDGTLYKVIKFDSEASTVAYLNNFYLVGTTDGNLVKFNEDGQVIWKKKIWDGSIDRIDLTQSGYIIVVASSTNMVLLNQNGDVITTHSYQWDLTRVAWTSDLSFLAVPVQNYVIIYRWDEKQGYVKDKEIRVNSVRKLKWCENKLAIADYKEFLVLEYSKSSISLRLRLEVIDFSWNEECRDLTLLSPNYLYYLKDVNSIATSISSSSA